MFPPLVLVFTLVASFFPLLVSPSPCARLGGLPAGSGCVPHLQPPAPRHFRSRLSSSDLRRRRRGERRNRRPGHQLLRCFLYSTPRCVDLIYLFFCLFLLQSGAVVPCAELRPVRSSVLTGVSDTGTRSADARTIPDLQTSLSLSWPPPAATW